MEVVRQVMNVAKLKSVMSLPWFNETDEVEVIVFPVTKKKKKTMNNDEFFKISGAWESDISAGEMVKEVKSARKFRKKKLLF
jgi:hypothetical protein